MSVNPKEASRTPEALPDSIIIPFQAIFNAMGEPLPEPEFSIGLGGFEYSPIPPCLWINFDARSEKPLRMEAKAYVPIKRDVIRSILALAEKQISDMSPEFRELKAPAGKMIVVASGPGSAGACWKLIFDKEKTMEVFRPHFSPDNRQSMHFLQINPCDSPAWLRIEFVTPDLSLDSRLAEKIFVPKVKIWGRYGNTQLDPAEVKHEKIRAFVQAVVRELEPTWRHRYNFQRESFAQDPKALKILEEENSKALKTLGILAGVSEVSS